MADQTISGNLTVTGIVIAQGTGTHSFGGTVEVQDHNTYGDGHNFGDHFIDGAQTVNGNTFLQRILSQVQHEIHTANYTITPGDSGKTFHNLGASGTTVYTLPSVAQGAVAGLSYRFSDAGGAHVITVNPDASSHLCDVGAAKAAGTGLSSSGSVSFGYLDITCLYLVGSAAYWRITNSRGTWA